MDRKTQSGACAMIAACLRWIGGRRLEDEGAERGADVGRVYAQVYDCIGSFVVPKFSGG